MGCTDPASKGLVRPQQCSRVFYLKKTEVDESSILVGRSDVRNTKPIHRTRPKVLDKDVGLFDEPFKRLLPVRALQVQDDGLLAYAMTSDDVIQELQKHSHTSA